jgi:hypothetical protein
MTSLEQLFAIGFVNETVDILGVQFGLTVLDTRRLTDALNAAVDSDTSAQNLNYKCEILARAITSINGQSNFADSNNPTKEEISHVLNGVIAKLHYTIVNALYEKYEKLDTTIGKQVENDVKKSLSSRGA